MGKNIHRLTAWLIFLLIAGGYLLMARHFPFAYIIATYEDLVGEWAQVYFFAATMGLAIVHAKRHNRFRPFYIVLALACFYVVGEEISWGQRIFDIETPEFFRKHNLQKETNLHNFLTGPISTSIKSALEFAIAAGLLGYGLLYPLALKFKLALALWLERLGLPGPPLFLFPFFLLSAFLELGPFSFNEAEVAEILIPSALSVMLLCSLAGKNVELNAQNRNGPTQAAGYKLATQIFLLFAAVLLTATATTWACYQTPHLRSRIESRFLNGVEKFAGRYKRDEMWNNAILLYQHVLEKEPHRASLHRNLYRCYLPLENRDKMQQHIESAIDIDNQRLKKKPNSVTAHVSLARNYRLIGNDRRAHDYLQQGLKIAKERVALRPASSSSAYWLGKIYELLNQPELAYPAYKRATELKPNNLKYRKAFLKIQQHSRFTDNSDPS